MFNTKKRWERTQMYGNIKEKIKSRDKKFLRKYLYLNFYCGTVKAVQVYKTNTQFKISDKYLHY